MNDYIEFKNSSKIHTIECDKSIRGQRANTMWFEQPILCHSCENKDVCKYQDDYLEQVVHLVDTYDGVFELNCCNYKELTEVYANCFNCHHNVYGYCYKTKQSTHSKLHCSDYRKNK